MQRPGMLEMAAPANRTVPRSHRKANTSHYPNIEFEEFRKHRKPGKVDARAEGDALIFSLCFLRFLNLTFERNKPCIRAVPCR
jgi:hypothetical protein